MSVSFSAHISDAARNKAAKEAEYQRQYRATHRDQIREQRREYMRQYRTTHRYQIRENERRYRYNHGAMPMSENRSCTAFLGVHVAERILSHLFKNVVRMPNNNPGYDFRCAKDYLIDVKSSCTQIMPSGTRRWVFGIKHNMIADYFLCMAFDNRDDLNPLHLWLIPGKVLSDHRTVSISENTLGKWSEYEKPIDKAITCCNVMKQIPISPQEA